MSAFRAWLSDVLQVTAQYVRPQRRVGSTTTATWSRSAGGPFGSYAGKPCDTDQCAASWGSYAHAADCPKAKAVSEALKG